MARFCFYFNCIFLCPGHLHWLYWDLLFVFVLVAFVGCTGTLFLPFGVFVCT